MSGGTGERGVFGRDEGKDGKGEKMAREDRKDTYVAKTGACSCTLNVRNTSPVA